MHALGLRAGIRYQGREPNCLGGPCVQVRALAPAEVEAQLRMALAEVVRTPASLLHALLDHSHGSYSQELWAAARQLEQRGAGGR